MRENFGKGWGGLGTVSSLEGLSSSPKRAISEALVHQASDALANYGSVCFYCVQISGRRAVDGRKSPFLIVVHTVHCAKSITIVVEIEIEEHLLDLD